MVRTDYSERKLDQYLQVQTQPSASTSAADKENTVPATASATDDRLATGTPAP